MSDRRFDVLGLGNAIVDVIAQTDEDFLERHSLRKGAMTLIDEGQAESLYSLMNPATITSGGSAANTIVGAASFGARAAFIGKVKSDGLGRVFTHDIRAMGVAVRNRSRRRRPGDGPLLRPGDAGRRANHEHLSRRLPEPHSCRRRRDDGQGFPPSSISRAICGIRRRPRMPFSRPRRSRTRRVASSH